MSEAKKNQSKKQSRNTAKDDFYDYDDSDTVKSGKKRKTEQTGKDAKTDKPKKEPNPSSVGNQLAIVLLSVISVFIVICYAFVDKVGIVGAALRNGLFGIFGVAAFAVPFLLFQMAIFWRRDVRTGAVKYKYIVAIFFLVFLSVIVHAIYGLSVGEEITSASLNWSNFKDLYPEGKAYQGGGFVGGIIALAFICALGYPGTLIFSVLFLIGFGMALFGLTPSECFQRFMFYRQRSRGVRRDRREAAEKKRAERAEQARAQQAARTTEVAVKKRASGIDSSIFEDDAEIGGTGDETVSEVLYPVGTTEDDSRVKLDDIFDKKDDDAVLSHYVGESDSYEDLTEDIPKKSAQMELVVEKKPISPKKTAPRATAPAAAPVSTSPAAAKPAAQERPRAPYVFPPITLLKIEAAKKNTDVSSELRENADKIIQTLDSFNVHVKISNVSRGPTITRYEVEPAAGTRVRSIINLLDDIALSLASSGVRSDGIIAGKSAIGIEVPNKTVNTVYVRELIEDEQFAEAKSKLTTSLGKDVSGSPVYLDIAKMPHLLIAGATGMGKSVCINSLLVSLLYKARPDEVKLILIDPKKVELNIYNGIPHLLVPVVFDPKKAAGSLHWAVTEMERRFELIEAQNTRNIAQYNAAVASDPTKELLPQIVIIIDELADLMMSAPDDVEASICRLAQKARAAGMHLIIGTQRPSVDVITGLIKANIPSRIAFTVASQIDSRTIIDMQGAEKLIGRGDMLYAPVGSSKPIRVQGSFVSEKEIEEIVDFIKAHSQDCAYSSEVIEQIDRAAEVCGQKKGKGGGGASADDGDDGEDTDPMLDSAIELAVESGKISTSLIQRRLSLGYGRAAKLIDVMERRGIVSAPDGQKPRAVLITREQYLEMKMNQTDAPSHSDDDDDGEAPF